MSQAQHTEYESGEVYQQHNDDAQFDVEFNVSWADFDIEAKLNTVGTAVREGAKRTEAFMENVQQITKLVVAGAVTCVTIRAIKAILE